MREKQRVILFGCGEFLRKRIKHIEEFCDIACLCDNNRQKWGTEYVGYEIISTDQLYENKNIPVVVTVENQNTKHEITEQLCAHGIKVLELDICFGKAIEIKDKVNIFNNGVKHFYIWGVNTECRELDRLLTLGCKDIVVEGYISHIIKNIGKDSVSKKSIISLTKAEELIREGKIDGIIAISETYSFNRVTRMSVSEDILESEKFYVVTHDMLSKLNYENLDIRSLFVNYKDCYHLGTVQFLVTKSCNLNCHLCSHFAPLTKKKEFYNIERYEEDLKRLAELTDGVDEIGLWGGEALLCPDLHKYVALARKYFPYSKIVIGSNGLIIDKVKEDLIDVMKETNAIFSISLYKPTLNRIDEIKELIDKWEIPVRFPREMKVDRFVRRYDLKGNNDIESNNRFCGERYCTTILDGKISGCYLPLLSEIFNEYYEGTYFDGMQEDILDLSDEGLTKRRLNEFLRRPMNACRYCGNPQPEEWSVFSKEKSIDDWLIR